VSVERTDDGKNAHVAAENHTFDSERIELQQRHKGKKSTPVYSSTVLKDGKEHETHNAEWNYRRVIGKLNFLCASCRPELSCAVHQCACFSADLHTNHTKAVKQIGWYLVGTVDKGIIMDPTPTDHSFKNYVDADFGGLWDREVAEHSQITSKSRTGYIVMYAGCPIIWGNSSVYYRGRVPGTEYCT
jgi:hypothetical protein